MTVQELMQVKLTRERDMLDASRNSELALALGKVSADLQQLLAAIAVMKPPVVNVPAPIVNVTNEPAQVTVEAAQITMQPIVVPAPVVNVAGAKQPNVTVNVPKQETPIVNVAAPSVTVESPTVNVAAPEVNVTVERAPLKAEVTRDNQGRIEGIKSV